MDERKKPGVYRGFCNSDEIEAWFRAHAAEIIDYAKHQNLDEAHVLIGRIQILRFLMDAKAPDHYLQTQGAEVVDAIHAFEGKIGRVRQ